MPFIDNRDKPKSGAVGTGLVWGRCGGVYFGGMAEWSNAAVLKTVGPSGSGGSNPSPSATHGDVLVLTSLMMECKHAGRREFALKSQFPKTSWQQHLQNGCLICRAD